MRNLIMSMALLALIGSPTAMAQTGGAAGGGANPSVPPSLAPSPGVVGGAPIGHRQPRVGDVPSEKDLNDPNDALSKENRLLDKKINSICRGC
jgi:hypothetical protein